MLKKEWSYTSTLPLDLHGLFEGELYETLGTDEVISVHYIEAYGE